MELMAIDELSADEIAELLIYEDETFRKNIIMGSNKYPRLNLESLTNGECWSLFHFHKEDLKYPREV